MTMMTGRDVLNALVEGWSARAPYLCLAPELLKAKLLAEDGEVANISLSVETREKGLVLKLLVELRIDHPNPYSLAWEKGNKLADQVFDLLGV